jgi:hypothetical protein
MPMLSFPAPEARKIFLSPRGANIPLSLKSLLRLFPAFAPLALLAQHLLVMKDAPIP